MKRIVVAGEVYNQNVGDQAIHDCLGFLLQKQFPEAGIISLDTSGRLAPGGLSARLTMQQRIALLQGKTRVQFPFQALNLFYQTAKNIRRSSVAWKPALENADLLVIGGGQLLMDDSLSFPLKLWGLSRTAASLNVACHFSGCGVGMAWSGVAKALFGRMLRQAITVTVRDDLSRERLDQYLPHLQATVTFDPAIWAGEVYSIHAVRAQTGRVALDVINPYEANLHLPPEKRRAEGEWLQAWLTLVRCLLDRGETFELYTTGSLADSGFASSLYDLVQQRGWQGVSLAARPHQVADLLRIYQGCSLVVAPRLHASILANALGIGSVGLSWDQKVKAYYRLTERADTCFEITDIFDHPVEIAAAVSAQAREPLPASKLNEWKERALENARIIGRSV